MTVSFTDFCDELIADLQTNVPGLLDARVHRYAAWDPEQQTTEAGERHLAVFPAAESPEDALPLVTGPGGDQLVQVYRIVYWEDASDESSRGIANQDGAEALLALLEAVRARLYVTANVFPPSALAGAEHIRYTGSVLAERSSTVRWFAVGVQVRTSITAS